MEALQHTKTVRTGWGRWQWLRQDHCTTCCRRCSSRNCPVLQSLRHATVGWLLWPWQLSPSQDRLTHQQEQQQQQWTHGIAPNHQHVLPFSTAAQPATATTHVCSVALHLAMCHTRRSGIVIHTCYCLCTWSNTPATHLPCPECILTATAEEQLACLLGHHGGTNLQHNSQSRTGRSSKIHL